MMHRLVKEKGRIKVELQAFLVGNDLCVIISGGDTPHIGAVALSVPRTSLTDSDKTSASTSILTLLGHKEDEPAKKVSHALASRFNMNVVVTCGIHLDDIEPEEIKTVGEMLDQLVEELICEVSCKL